MPSPIAPGRVALDQLARLAGVDTDEQAYRLLRLGRSNGHPETTTCDRDRVAVVAVLARLEAILKADDRYLEGAARLLHRAASSEVGLIGQPRAVVVPVDVGVSLRGTPRPVLSSRAGVGALLAGRAGFVVDLGDIVTDWSKP